MKHIIDRTNALPLPLDSNGVATAQIIALWRKIDGERDETGDQLPRQASLPLTYSTDAVQPTTSTTAAEAA